MKKIINGKIYDTETAEVVRTEDCYLYVAEQNPFNNKCYLYRKKNGEFFIYYENIQHIKPIDKEWLKEWAETQLTFLEYLELFPETTE